MSDDDFEDEPDIDEDFEVELDEDTLEEDADLDEVLVVDEVLVAGVTDDVAVGDDDDDDDAVDAVKEDDDEVIDLDEELHPDDVEEALDVVLRERTAKAGLEDDEEDEPEDRAEAGNKIVPRRPGEFVCSSCFLVLPRHMLADDTNQLCSDCV